MRQTFRIILSMALLAFSGQLMAQQEVEPDQTSCDCHGRIELTDTVIKALNSPPGPGRVIEFDAVPFDPFSFETEHNTVWYEFTSPSNCILEIDIIPDDSTDNYDFLLFNYYTIGTCDSIKDDWIPAIRSAISENPAFGGMTGLSDTAIDLNVPSGPGYAYVKSLPVRQGYRYILVLDNRKRNGSGHTVHLKYRGCADAPGVPQAPTLDIRVFITDAEDKPLEGEILLKQRYSRSEGPDTAFDGYGYQAVTEITQSAYYELFVKTHGYLTYNERFRFDSQPDSIIKHVKLKEIEIGSTELFTPVYFRKESDRFDGNQKDALEQIIDIMEENPEIKVELQGHVSRPENLHGWIGDMEDKSLGELRAKALKKYLVKKRIEEDRIEIRNMEHSDMVYPYAKNQEEMGANRRVEVMVVGLMK